ncbi:hypothetical protein N7492_006619 [Penicillium capsulatum]|uniref:F-box domain-containing protein n=1 Tax=Penicillium capsulatum TaxID=69766 RepID=A0A9W9HYA8_9EURO|nr:hypothetical protein N7492_006619 [Penicillium capsulatum]KAJ6116454.1 hypothetical protein N7512_006179 [Penicillium capsulatum]
MPFTFTDPLGVAERHVRNAILSPQSTLTIDDFDPDLPPPTLEEAQMDSDSLSVLLLHPRWIESCDVENWRQDELKRLLFTTSTDLQQAQITMPRPVPNVWEPQTEEVLVTGAFSMCSPELIWNIIRHLDFKSLSNFQQTCRYIRAVAHQTPAVQVVLKAAPDLPRLLVLNQLVRWHTVHDFIVELGQLKCRFCGASATALYLPTCERICFTCLRWNEEFALLPLKICSRLFSLKREESAPRLPILRCKTDGSMGPPLAGANGRDLYVVPARSVVAEALAVHGSLPNLVRAAQKTNRWAFSGIAPESDRLTMAYLYRHIVFQTHRLDPRNITLCDPTQGYYMAMEAFLRFASVDYPLVPREDREVPQMGFCRGCTHVLGITFPLSWDQLEYLGFRKGDDNRMVRDFLQRRAYRYWEWDDLYEAHLDWCLGAQAMMYREFRYRTLPSPVDSEEDEEE